MLAQDSRGRTAGTGKSVENSRTEQLEKTVRVGQERIGRTGQGGQMK
jgi:hypothetical protein